MTAQTMVSALVYVLLLLWGTSVLLLLVAMRGYDLPRLGWGMRRRSRATEPSLRSVPLPATVARLPAANTRPAARRTHPAHRPTPRRATATRPRPSHLRVVGL